MVLPTLSFTQVNDVLESWMLVQMTPDYTEQAGTLLFQEFFALHPEAISIFSFGTNKSMNAELFKSPRFLVHARFFMRTFGSAIDMLGPNMEVMHETLTELGEKHKQYGVTKAQYRFMGIALIETIRTLAGEKYTADHNMAWEQCWKVMSYTMQHGKAEGVSYCQRS